MMEYSKTQNRDFRKADAKELPFDKSSSGGTPKVNVLMSNLCQANSQNQPKVKSAFASNRQNSTFKSKSLIGSQRSTGSKSQQLSGHKGSKFGNCEGRQDSPLVRHQIVAKPSKWSPFEPRNVAKEDFYSFDNFINHKTVVYSDAEVKMIFQGRDQRKEKSEPQFIPNSFVPDSQSNNISNHFHQSSTPPRQNVISQKSLSSAQNSNSPANPKFNQVAETSGAFNDEDVSEGSLVMVVGVDKLEIDYDFLRRMAPPEMQSQRNSKQYNPPAQPQSQKETPTIVKPQVNYSHQQLMHDPYEEDCGISFTKIESHMIYKASRTKMNPVPPKSKTQIKPSRKDIKNASIIRKPPIGSISFSKANPPLNLISDFEPLKPSLVDSVIIKAPEPSSAKLDPGIVPKESSKTPPIRRKTADNAAINRYFELMYSKKPLQILSEAPCQRPNSQISHRNRLGTDPFLQFKETMLKRI